MNLTELFQPVLAQLNLNNGIIEPCDDLLVRHLSDLQGYFQDDEATQALLKENPVLYRVYTMPSPGDAEGLLVGTTVLEPGCVGDEYYMTKGHFHVLEGAPEVYMTLAGEGRILIETQTGESVAQEMKTGSLHYIPGQWAHRTINTGSVPLVFLAIWPANAGHNYGAIAEKGFSTLVLKGQDGPKMVPNPNFKK